MFDFNQDIWELFYSDDYADEYAQDAIMDNLTEEFEQWIL